jgi:LCP family protein required for cell wall assembly
MSDSIDYPQLAQRRLAQRGHGRRDVGRSIRARGARPYLTTSESAAAHHQRRHSDAVVRPRFTSGREADGPATPQAVAPQAMDATPDAGDGTSFLAHELGRLREQQARPRGRRIMRRPRTRWGVVALATPLLLLVAVAAIVGPVVYRGTRAYQEVFVEPAPRKPVPVAVRNAEGTAVIVMATVPAEDATEEMAPTTEPTATAIPRTETPAPTRGGSTKASPVAASPTITRTPTVTPTPSITPTATSTPGEIPKWNGTGRLTMLLLGVDRREDEPSRSDTMILVNVDPVSKTASMVAIPRDLRVIIPGYGVHKVNAAYAFGEADGVKGGGPALVIQTIETNFGVHIDYFAEVDFAGFVKIVDTVGGVTIDVPYPIKDDAYPANGDNYMRVYFPAGWQHLDGERALQYARTRHDDGDGMRSVRQQQVLMALRAQAVSFDLLAKAGELLGELADAVRTDLSPTQALQLARLATELSPDGIRSLTLDPALTADDSPEGYYLDADWDKVGQVMSDFAGVAITPPMSALGNPRLDAPIRIEDGTGVEGLGERAAEVLRERGFTNVTVVAHDADPESTSSIATNESDVPTAFLVAGLIGVELDAVTLRPSAAPTHSPPSPKATKPGTKGTPRASATKTPKATATPTVEPDPDKNGIVVSLGANARDPADFVGEPFQDDAYPVGKKKGDDVADPTIEQGG